MREGPEVPSVAAALGELGRYAGGIEAGHFMLRPDLLVIFGGPEMEVPSPARTRLAEQVRQILLKRISELQPVEHRMTAEALFAIDPETRDMNVSGRVEHFHATGRGLTTDIYNKRRPAVLKSLAGSLIDDLRHFNYSGSEPSARRPREYDRRTIDLLADLVWHAQNLSCYLLAYQELVKNANMLRDGRLPSFADWQKAYGKVTKNVIRSFWEYCKIGELIWELQQTRDGRTMLRHNGLMHLIHPNPYGERFVPIFVRPPEPILLRLDGPFGDRDEFIARAETDDRIRYALNFWSLQLTQALSDEHALGNQVGSKYLATKKLLQRITDVLESIAKVSSQFFVPQYAMDFQSEFMLGAILEEGSEEVKAAQRAREIDLPSKATPELPLPRTL